MKIAVLGPKGTFSDKAYLEYEKYYKQQSADAVPLEPVYFPTIDDVFRAVDEDEVSANTCDIGIVPIENTLDGYVMRTLDLILEKNVCILDENLVEVQFSLVGNVKSKDDINKLYVQFKAHGQCRQFIDSLNEVSICTTESNMESYYRIENNPGEAAVVPKHIADTETKRFVIDHVTDADNNYTRFVIFKRGKCDSTEVNSAKQRMNYKGDAERVRIPVYIMPKIDRPGILFEILRDFYENKINLISIISRPTKQGIGTYNFYIEIDGLYESIDIILKTLDKIRVDNDIKVLGIYGE
ncbi:MAG: ACT domain-containing protein [Lachnospiraceae bacterium]|nr:ACT domain-containing protein [Lachnospiraceae bacterium]